MTKTLRIDSYVRNSPGSMLFAGMSFLQLSKNLDPPKWWYVSFEDPCYGIFGYGDLEIDFVVVDCRVEVRRASLKLWDTEGENPIPKARRIRIGSNTRVDLCGYKPGISIDAVKILLDRDGIEYKEKSVSNVSETKFEINTDTNSRFLFFFMNGRNSLAEINIYDSPQM